ncbi:hypothetical protein ADEAN_000426000 [Angomonas deanei]|uniref:Uncharacterized protein n=1 Tax=Angomonas deanei TaxID=59799 RepID=A0A7G2CF79_9TRYP|nr:hypothetical protein ADEAN_000426000 [Angomonas deanei]
MHKGNFILTFYIIYGALVIGLLFTSILCPLVEKNIGGCQLHVFGIRMMTDLSGAGCKSSAGVSQPSSPLDLYVLQDAPVCLSASVGANPAGDITYLHNVPAGTLKNLMVAYLFFAGLSLFSALSTVAVSIAHLVTKSKFIDTLVQYFVVFGATLVSVLLTFILATVIVASNDIYADLLETLGIQGSVNTSARSGFSCTVAAAGMGMIAILVVVLSVTNAL